MFIVGGQANVFLFFAEASFKKMYGTRFRAKTCYHVRVYSLKIHRENTLSINFLILKLNQLRYTQKKGVPSK